MSDLSNTFITIMGPGGEEYTICLLPHEVTALLARLMGSMTRNVDYDSE